MPTSPVSIPDGNNSTLSDSSSSSSNSSSSGVFTLSQSNSSDTPESAASQAEQGDRWGDPLSPSRITGYNVSDLLCMSPSAPQSQGSAIRREGLPPRCQHPHYIPTHSPLDWPPEPPPAARPCKPYPREGGVPKDSGPAPAPGNKSWPPFAGSQQARVGWACGLTQE